MSSDTDFIALKARVAELEDRVKFLYNHLKIDYVAEPLAADAQAVALIKSEKLIDAVKAYREIYNVGLAEAKQAVDQLQGKLGM